MTGNDQHDVVITGFLPGVDEAAAKKKLGDLFRATAEQIERVCDRLPYTAKSGVDLATATRYREALVKVGFACKGDVDDFRIELPEISQVVSANSTLRDDGTLSPKAAPPAESKSSSITRKVLYTIGAVIFLGGAGARGYDYLSKHYFSPSGSSALASRSGPSKDEAAVLYEYWQRQNVPEAGRYQDELVDGKVLLACKASGGNPAHFGWIRVKTVFDMVALRDAKPFKVYVGGVNWGGRREWFIQPEESKGEGILGRLKLAGCEIPPQLLAPSQTAQEPAAGAPRPVRVPNTTLPSFIDSEPYGELRARLIAQGWTPHRSPDAGTCGVDDKRCEGRPELDSCASAGAAQCKFTWKREGKIVAVITAGEIDAKVVDLQE
jgi:hypothetical protein